MKQILVTGAKGFLGKQIVPILAKIGHIDTLGIESDNDYTIDFTQSGTIIHLEKQYDVVVHLAGKAHMIPRTEEEKAAFFSINAEGTRKLLKSLEEHPPKQFVLISTVAVYGRETGSNINEDHALNGDTPYALSKIEAEDAVIQWAKVYGVESLIIRPPLIAGPTPPGNLGKMIKGIQTSRYLSINGGKAKRSIIMAEDVGNFILSSSGKGGIYNITDNYHPSFREIEVSICQQLGKKLSLSLPSTMAQVLGKVGDFLPFFPVNSDTIKKMSLDLTFDSSKASKELNWEPMAVLEHFCINKD